MPKIELYDTTLRDGAQSEGIPNSIIDKEKKILGIDKDEAITEQEYIERGAGLCRAGNFDLAISDLNSVLKMNPK